MKVTQIYSKTGELRAVQLLLGRTKTCSIVRSLGVKIEDALAISEILEIRDLGPPSSAAQTWRSSA